MSSDFELVELILSVRFHALLSVLPHYKRRSGGEYQSLIQSGLLNVLSTKASLAIEAQQYQVQYNQTINYSSNLISKMGFLVVTDFVTMERMGFFIFHGFCDNGTNYFFSYY